MSEDITGSNDATQQPVEVKSDGAEAQEKTYTNAEVQQLIVDRLNREKAKYEKQIGGLKTEYETKLKAPKEADESKQRLADYEKKLQQSNERINRFRQDNLRTKIESKLAAKGCVSADIATDHILARGLATIDEDDQIAVDAKYLSLDSMLDDFETSHRDLFKKITPGAGSKPPVSVNVTEPDALDRYKAMFPGYENRTKKFGAKD